MFITIPCHDEPRLLETLESLRGCMLPDGCPVVVLVVVNSSAEAPDDLKVRNWATFREAETWAKAHSTNELSFEIRHCPDLPPRHAGVGLARKLAMDEAAERLLAARKPGGIIACLDADTLVQANYLTAIHDFFAQNPRCQAASMHYEHPLDGSDFSPEIFAAIARYELHLRYYVAALRGAGLATATQTVGSAMAIRADAYRAQGGMNRRQAGEDFYFLHKFTVLGTHGEIRGTTVLPSPRTSHRVPFGTGRAVGEMLLGKDFETYSPLIFKDLEVFLEQFGESQISEIFQISETSRPAWPPAVAQFLEQENFEEKIAEIRANTASPEAARKRFFRWFDPFRAMKFVHFARDHFYPNWPVERAAAAWLLEQKSLPVLGQREGLEKLSAGDLLLIFRELDKFYCCLSFCKNPSKSRSQFCHVCHSGGTFTAQKF